MPRGQKACPKCGVAAGPRTKVCADCGHTYVLKGKTSAPLGTSTAPAATTGPPPYVPESKRTACDCPTHPKYKAVQPPKVACEACWRMFLREKFEDRVQPFDDAIVIVANDPDELRKFIVSLKSAQDRNAHTGGGYGAYFHAKDGQVLQINVQVPIGVLRGNK